MSNKLKKLKNTLLKIQEKNEEYKKLFLEDGTLDQVEQAQLNELDKQIKIIQETIDAIESPNKQLDKLYEIIIETHQKVKTNPVPENKKYYQEITQHFLDEFEKAPAALQSLWKKVYEKIKSSNEKISKNLEKIEQVKDRIDNLEETESAKIYCIIKGTNPDGTQWGRIDFVGANYVDKVHNKVEYAGKDSNKIPLLVKYYTYENGGYKHLKDSNKLETAFDKQLMDTFLKAGKISYEQYKNLDRDYEYTPKKGAVIGSGDWYINVGKLAQENHIEKVIEVPDWDDFGFQSLYDEYVDKCEKGVLPPEDRDQLKKEMQVSISKQKELVEELKQFHTNENDQEENTADLIEVWKKRIGALEENITNLKDDCFKPKPIIPFVTPIVTPPTPPPITGPIPSMPPITFTPSSFKKQSGYDDVAKKVAEWLINNPDYNIKIISDAQGRQNLDKSAKWRELIPGSHGLMTYEKRLNKLLTAYKNDIIKASNKRVTKDRILTARGNVDDYQIST